VPYAKKYNTQNPDINCSSVWVRNVAYTFLNKMRVMVLFGKSNTDEKYLSNEFTKHTK